ncbi:MAG: hypothetical protein AABW83_02955 [Nanoarchaeota archaeon]
MKKIFFLIILGILIFSSISFIIAQEFNVCCEKTKSGAWCQNTKDDQCDDKFRKTPTSCDATSYCKLGVCIDSAEGLCMENTPQKVCEISKGTWVENSEEIPQCNLGCCNIGNQASFVTLTRCKRLSSLYGLETNFKTDIKDEASCILTSYSSDVGACVFEKEGGKSCKIATRGDCSKGINNSTEIKTEFFEDYLCSNDELATECGPTEQTTCVEGKDEIYFKDSCGNYANIYDANRIYSKDPSYWQKIVKKENSCNPKDSKGNAGSKTCGNCNYLSGSICKKGQATYGNLACKDLNCYKTENGKNYKNGESWCLNEGTSDNGQDTVGSRFYRHVCINGEETIEPCADFRNEVCIEESLSTSQGSFIEAACRANRWVDCIDQLEQDDCENTDKRDCYWIEGVHYDGSNSKTIADQKVDTKVQVQKVQLADSDPKKENTGILKGGGICLPRHPPGLEHWKEGNAGNICSLANSRQTIKYEEGLFGNKKCKENCEVLSAQWVNNMNKICVSLGDCGNYENLAGRSTDDGIVVKDNGVSRKISQGIVSDAETEEKGFLGGLFD